MGFIKKNAFLLACAAVGLVSLGMMLWGMSSMSKVRAEMDVAEKLNRELDRYTKNPVNTKAIDSESERIRLVRNYHKEVLEHFGEKTSREPLLEGVFPDPPPGAEGKKNRYEFQTKYRQAMEGLLSRLHAGQPPSREQLDYTADYLKRKAMEAVEFGVHDGGASTPAGQAGATPAVSGGSRPAGKQKDLKLPQMDGPGSTAAYFEVLQERAGNDPGMLASISNARSMYCYGNSRPGGSLELHPIFLRGGDSAPGMADIWNAQLWYWLQEDIVEALARVNDRAAEKLDHPWVGNLPIKDVISIRISDYVQESNGQDAPVRRGGFSDRPPQNSNAAWTYEASQALYDVVNIRATVAIDVRALPAMLNEFCHEKYYNILNVSYEAVPPGLSFREKIYGPQPVVVVIVDLQSYMFYKSYVRFMPEVIREQLGIPEKEFEKLVKELEGGAGGETDAGEPAEGQG